MRKSGCSIAQVARSLGIRESLVEWWLRGNRPKRIHRYEPDLRPSRDLAYVAGFYLGNGRKGNREHKVGFMLADEAQAQHINTLIARILERPPKPIGRQGTFYVVDYDSVALSDFLNSGIESLLAHFKNWERHFLRGFFDAEGYASCGVDVGRHKITEFIIGAANSRMDYLLKFRELLESLGFHPRLRCTNRAGGAMMIRGRAWIRRHDVYHILLTRSSEIGRFKQEIGFENPTKSQKLKDLLLMVPLPPKKRYVWFRAHYAKKGHKWVRIA